MSALPTLGSQKNSPLARIIAITILLAVLVSGVVPTVFARNTYVITDGDETKIYTTYTTDPAQVLDQAGIQLGADDTYTTVPGDGETEITVQRSRSISIYNCGVLQQEISYGETVQQLLDRMGIPSYGDYIVSVPLDQEVYNGVEIQVDCVVQSRQTYTEDIPFETVPCYDPTLPEGVEKILVPGVNGQVSKTADVVYVNKVQTSHTVLEETVIQQPVDQIVAVGTGKEENANSNAPAIGDGVIVTADGEVLTYSHAAHFVATAYTHTDAGCDMITATGTTVHIGTVAVDPKVIPYGTRMFIVTNDGSYVYGISTAEDCGSSIKNNRVDLYMPTTAECFRFGVKDCTVYFLD